jgi:hypothetical protein
MGLDLLLTYLDEKANKYHRGTVRYDGDNTDVAYLRDDIREERLDSQIDRMLRRVRPEASAKEERSFPFGDFHCTARVFDEALVLHFPTGKDRGIVVTLEPETARDMNTFIGECESRIQQ